MGFGPPSEKICLWCLRTTKAQTSLLIPAVWLAPLLFAVPKVSYQNMLQAKFRFLASSVAEKTGFVPSRPY